MRALTTRKSDQRDSKRESQGVGVLVYQGDYTVLSAWQTAIKKSLKTQTHGSVLPLCQSDPYYKRERKHYQVDVELNHNVCVVVQGQLA